MEATNFLLSRLDGWLQACHGLVALRITAWDASCAWLPLSRFFDNSTFTPFVLPLVGAMLIMVSVFETQVWLLGLCFECLASLFTFTRL